MPVDPSLPVSCVLKNTQTQKGLGTRLYKNTFEALVFCTCSHNTNSHVKNDVSPVDCDVQTVKLVSSDFYHTAQGTNYPLRFVDDSQKRDLPHEVISERLDLLAFLLQSGRGLIRGGVSRATGKPGHPACVPCCATQTLQSAEL